MWIRPLGADVRSARRGALSPGTYEYKFLVNRGGKQTWMADPLDPVTGGGPDYDSVIVVP